MGGSLLMAHAEVRTTGRLSGRPLAEVKDGCAGARPVSLSPAFT
jgi:hypothetical protein